MNPGGLRGLGVMARAGDAVYLPLRRGRNELVFAVIQCTGGWAFSARLGRRAQRERETLPAIAQQSLNGRDRRSSPIAASRAVKLVPAARRRGRTRTCWPCWTAPTSRTARSSSTSLERRGPACRRTRGDSSASAFAPGARGEWSEVFYLRPTNGRAEDQLRRNHAVQYGPTRSTPGTGFGRRSRRLRVVRRHGGGRLDRR